jgi:hypothetical protein
MELACYCGGLRLCDKRGLAVVIRAGNAEEAGIIVVIRTVSRFSQPGINHSNIGAAEQHCWIFHGKQDIAVEAESHNGSFESPACAIMQPEKVRAPIVSDNDKPEFDSTSATLVLSPETNASPEQMQEARIRRAWGLDGEAPRMRLPERVEPQPMPRPAERFTPGAHKRRFVQDGEVPVTLVHGLTGARREHHEPSTARATVPTNRLEVAETALAAEISSREKAEKALAESQAMVQQLQTKLGHADLARQDAVAALQREKETIAELRTALAEAEARAVAGEAARVAAEDAPGDAQAPPTSNDETMERPEPARRGRKPKALAAAAGRGVAASAKGADATSGREPKPIRWWLTPKRSTKAR